MDIKKLIYNATYEVKEHSSEILFVTGLVGSIATTVWACKKTVKEVDIIDYHNERIEGIEEVYDDVTPEDTEGMKAKKKETAAVYKETFKRTTKNYAGPLAMGLISYGCMTGGFVKMRGKYLSASAAAATFSAMYKKLSKNVIDKYGRDEYFDLRYGAQNQEIEEVKTLKNGKEKVVKTNIKTIDDISTHSEYSRFFDASSPHYYKDPGLNLSFIIGIQEWANRQLKLRGRLFLNEVYRELGLEESRAGQFVGWRYDPDDPSGDNEIDFNIFSYNEANRRFVNGYEPVILLDFNVDGNIIDLEFPRID